MVNGRQREAEGELNPKVEHGEKVYFTASDGSCWRVYDTWMAGGKHAVATPPRVRAQSRAFVSADGVRKLCRFNRGEARSLTPALLEQQLRRAEYLATKKYDPSEREARTRFGGPCHSRLAGKADDRVEPRSLGDSVGFRRGRARRPGGRLRGAGRAVVDCSVY